MKKILALAVGAIFSHAAHAGYTQYTFLSGGVNGFFIQHDEDQSIAMYEMESNGRYNGWFSPSSIFSNIMGASTWSPNAPTEFSVFNTLTDVYEQSLEFTFLPTGTDGVFNYVGRYYQMVMPGVPKFDPDIQDYAIRFTGSVTKTMISQEMINYLDAEEGYMNGTVRILPTVIAPPNPPSADVPEPASIALWFASALAFVPLIGRRRKS